MTTEPTKTPRFASGSSGVINGTIIAIGTFCTYQRNMILIQSSRGENASHSHRAETRS